MKKTILAIFAFAIVVAVFTTLKYRTSIPTVPTIADSTIAAAQAKGQRADYTRDKGREPGLNCLGLSDGCAELITRAEKNPQLKKAFLEAKVAGIGIVPKSTLTSFTDTGYIGAGYVAIKIQATDEEIIAFLTN